MLCARPLPHAIFRGSRDTVMDQRARALLEKLLHAGEKHRAGARSRPAALRRADLVDYRNEKSLQSKEAFETTMRAAQAEEAIAITLDKKLGYEGFIERVDLLDVNKLAKFLGEIPNEKLVNDATQRFSAAMKGFPVLSEVLHRWSQIKKVRGLGPDSLDKWLDAIRVIVYTRKEAFYQVVSLPIREVSARIFKDSKRIEKLAGPLDVLLAGSVESDIRKPEAVWQELGLFREELPVRLAGNIRVERDRVTAFLDVPYTSLPADTIKCIVDIPDRIMTIENQTTFHSEARKRCNERILLLYTGGMPSPTWRAMYTRLLKSVPESVPVFHWGDIDEGGFRIAARLAQDAQAAGHAIQPWKMHPSDIPVGLRRKATSSTLDRILYFAQVAGWRELGEEVVNAGFTVEQEGL